LEKERLAWQTRLEEEREMWQGRLEELLEANQGLTTRVEALEKPRGLRALWWWLFGRKKSSPGTKKGV
jgi:hypothetical protein